MAQEPEIAYREDETAVAQWSFAGVWLYCRGFCKFGLASFSAALLDIGVFSLLFYVLFKDMPELSFAGWNIDIKLVSALVAARAVSSAWNFAVNRYLVFSRERKERNSLWNELVKYYVLVIAVLAAAAAVTYLLGLFIADRWIAAVKVAVDIVLFIVVYWIQKNCIFKNKE